MREIKFKAWHIEIKQILIVYVINQKRHAGEEYCGLCCGYYGDNMQVEFTYDEVEWMQYTGLKDRNGKEIYEGDICDGHSDGIGVITWTEFDGGYDYVFKDEANVGIWEVKNDIKIIGNIYENPELISTL